MSTTATDLREQLITTIQGISATLGFDEPDGNVHGVLLDFVDQEDPGAYLMAQMQGKREVGAWGVQVTENERPYNSQQWSRIFAIVIKGYASLGEDEQHDLLDNSRRVRNAVRALGACMNGLVTQISDVSEVELAVETVGIATSSGQVQTITWSYSAFTEIGMNED